MITKWNKSIILPTNMNAMGSIRNSIESLWALVKRVYMGIHHHWSDKHMQKYLNACVFRINRKKVDTLSRVDDMLNMAMGARLTYKQLVASEAVA